MAVVTALSVLDRFRLDGATAIAKRMGAATLAVPMDVTGESIVIDGGYTVR